MNFVTAILIIGRLNDIVDLTINYNLSEDQAPLHEVYLDDNQDFKRAMNVNVVPHVFIIDGNGEIVWAHNSYAEGDEIKLYDNIKHLIKGEKLEH